MFVAKVVRIEDICTSIAVSAYRFPFVQCVVSQSYAHSINFRQRRCAVWRVVVRHESKLDDQHCIQVTERQGAAIYRVQVCTQAPLSACLCNNAFPRAHIGLNSRDQQLPVSCVAVACVALPRCATFRRDSTARVVCVLSCACRCDQITGQLLPRCPVAWMQSRASPTCFPVRWIFVKGNHCSDACASQPCIVYMNTSQMCRTSC